MRPWSNEQVVVAQNVVKGASRYDLTAGASAVSTGSVTANPPSAATVYPGEELLSSPGWLALAGEAPHCVAGAGFLSCHVAIL